MRVAGEGSLTSQHNQQKECSAEQARKPTASTSERVQSKRIVLLTDPAWDNVWVCDGWIVYLAHLHS